jgi:hypothetical protein
MTVSKSMTSLSHIDEALERQGMIVTVPVGTSMWPMLRNRKDNIVIRKTKGPLKKYDVPLYRRANGQFVLHRILDVKPDGYVICGDNQYRMEHGVKESQILGVLTAFYRGDRFVDCNSNKKYLLYVKIWCFSVNMRIPILKLRQIVHRLRNSIAKSTML